MMLFAFHHFWLPEAGLFGRGSLFSDNGVFLTSLIPDLGFYGHLAGMGERQCNGKTIAGVKLGLTIDAHDVQAAWLKHYRFAGRNIDLLHLLHAHHAFVIDGRQV